MNDDPGAAALAVPSPALAAKIAKVQKAAEVGNLPKRHVVVTTNAGGSYSYDYTTESVLMEKIRPLLAEEGVATYYSDEILTLSGNAATVRVYLTLVDGETGQSFTMRTDGMAADKGDKAVNKAKTGAMRYLLWKWFLVPSEGDDPETESTEISARQPRSQIKFAKEEDVEAFLVLMQENGYDRAKYEEGTLTPHRAEWEGVRQDFLDAQRRDLEGAIARKAAAAEAPAE